VISGFPTGVVMILCAVLTLWASAFAGIRAELRADSPGRERFSGLSWPR
jgi:hypothetical protein